MKSLAGTFNQEKALFRGLLRDCEIFRNFRITFVSSSNGQQPQHHWPVAEQMSAGRGTAPAPGTRALCLQIHTSLHLPTPPVPALARAGPGHTCHHDANDNDIHTRKHRKDKTNIYIFNYLIFDLRTKLTLILTELCL